MSAETSRERRAVQECARVARVGDRTVADRQSDIGPAKPAEPFAATKSAQKTDRSNDKTRDFESTAATTFDFARSTTPERRVARLIASHG